MARERTTDGGMAPLVMDTEAAARQLGLSPRTLERWRVERRGPTFIRVGKRRIYRLQDLEAFVSAGVVPREAA
jgi:CRP-like cAMP-binding protein